MDKALITRALKKQEMTQQQPQQPSTSSNQSEDEEDRLPTPPPLPDVSNHYYSVLKTNDKTFFVCNLVFRASLSIKNSRWKSLRFNTRFTLKGQQVAWDLISPREKGPLLNWL
jgi:hypothetical protein